MRKEEFLKEYGVESFNGDLQSHLERCKKLNRLLNDARETSLMIDDPYGRTTLVKGIFISYDQTPDSAEKLVADMARYHDGDLDSASMTRFLARAKILMKNRAKTGS